MLCQKIIIFLYCLTTIGVIPLTCLKAQVSCRVLALGPATCEASPEQTMEAFVTYICLSGLTFASIIFFAFIFGFDLSLCSSCYTGYIRTLSEEKQ